MFRLHIRATAIDAALLSLVEDHPAWTLEQDRRALRIGEAEFRASVRRLTSRPPCDDPRRRLVAEGVA